MGGIAPLNATSANTWQKRQVLDRIADVAILPISWKMQAIGSTVVLYLLEIGGRLSLNKYCGSRIIKEPSYISGQRMSSGKFSEFDWVAEVR